MDRSIWLALASAFSFAICTVSFAQISGKVTLDGAPPQMREIKEMAAIPQCDALHKKPVYEDTVVTGANGELANVIVFIKEDKLGELKGPQIDKPAKLDQKGCMYIPHVLAVEVGQPFVLVNSDPLLHSARTITIDNKPFNVAQINVGVKVMEPFIAVETFEIKCDIHPWMTAIVRVFDNPYFATTGKDGKFSIDTNGLKDGTYTVQAWHERYKDSEPQTVEVKDGKATKEVDFTYKAGAKAQAVSIKTIHLASLGATAGCCEVKGAVGPK